jgi:hydroxyacylglutathione hydrolase
MLQFKSFEFSPFAENTYVLYDTDTLEAWIIDPGCYDQTERNTLLQFINSENLKPIRLLNTHCHLDHIFGNAFVHRKWNLKPQCHSGELIVLQRFEQVCQMYGIPNVEPSPEPEVFLTDRETLILGNYTFETILAPGHSPASLCFYCASEHLCIGGDVLFLESIGRTDLPGGNHEQLLKSIQTRLFTLPDETMILSGHGSATTIRHERAYNPFF